jgi:polysaccharide biosynthesis/export protein
MLTVSLFVSLLLWLPSAALSDDPSSTTINTPAIPRTEANAEILGPDDRVSLAAPDIEELDKRVLRIEPDGTVSVPLIGRIKAGGLTVQQFENDLTAQLKTLFKNPCVSVTVLDIESERVSVLGAVNHPGVQQVNGKKTLLEALSDAGGLREDAGPVVELTRGHRAVPANADTADHLQETSFAAKQISVSGLMEARNPADNVVIRPGDVITVPKAKMVYVVGDVKRSGGFVIGESDSLTILKALALAEGLQATASPAHARIIRTDQFGKRSERQIDMRDLLDGKVPDVPLQADDILFVPSSVPKKAAIRALEAAIETGSGIAIWRR